MKKIFSLILTITMLMGLFSACEGNGVQHNNTFISENPSQTATLPSDTVLAQTEPESPPTSNMLTHKDIIAWLNEYADQKGFEHITNVTSKPCDNPEETQYSFQFMQDIINVDVIEAHGQAHTVVAYVFPFALSLVSSLEEAMVLGMSLVTLPITPCEPGLEIETNMEWHRQKILENADTSEETTLTSDYSGSEWDYHFLANSITVMLGAKKKDSSNNNPNYTDFIDGISGSDSSGSTQNTTIPTESPELQPTSAPSIAPRICAQCGKSEPDVEIPSTSDICFGCNYDNQVETKLYCANCGEDCTFRGLYNGLCDDCLRLSVDINTGTSATEPPATQPPAGCRHNYTAATCTTPKTCILCGKTEGFAMGHYYSSATCTTPETCIICGAVRGIAAGHNYAEATCTSPITCMICGMTTGNAAGHNYTSATCTAPKTCTICGSTTGNATGHNYTSATCTDPMTCTLCGATRGTGTGHSWIAITEIVYHEEQGHYEDVQVAKKIQKYRCWLCSYADPTFETLSAYYAHFDKTHGDEANSSFFRERYETVEDWTYVYETKWFVDTPAYSEKVVTGYKCSACGEEK